MKEKMSTIKKLLCMMLAVCLVFALAACGGAAKEESAEGTDVPKEEQEGTAGSNMPLKDNVEEAEKQITIAVENDLKEAYGDKLDDVRIRVTKVYSTEDEQANEVLKQDNLSPEEVAFEVSYDLHPAAGVDEKEFLAGNGEYDEASGWIVDKSAVGVLEPADDGTYTIKNFGTGW